MSFNMIFQLVFYVFIFFFATEFSYANVQIDATGPTFTVTGRVNVTNDTPNGTVISEKFIAPSPYSGSVNFTNDTGTIGSIVFATVATLAYGDDVYATGTQGIGIRYFLTVSSDSFFGSSQTGEYTIKNKSFTWNLTRASQTGTKSFSMPFAVQFVKTGDVGTVNTINTIPLVTVNAYNHTGTAWPKPNMVSSSSNVTVTNSTCSQPGSPTINLPQVRASAFPSAGSVSGEKPFPIDSNCSGNVKFQFTFKLTSDFYNSSKSILNNKLTGPGAAKGYGIQIVDENNNEIDANNAIYKTTTDSNNFHKSLKARYYRTNDMVQPGKIESALLYTFDYY
ncbi:fimbrial protein [Buttiauxella gaviniae]|uniref:fimbrial protein n=1 Tax=Buttiauxella gaviniae TaxID=82990 RepID=UPI0039751FB8